MPTKTFSPVTAEQVAAVKAKLVESGCTVTDDKVTITKSVFGTQLVIGATYVLTGNQLTLTITDLPSLVPENTVWAEIEKVIKSV
jgi:hypothetical protein